MLGGMTKSPSELNLTYRCDCWLYDATRCRTSWCEHARDMPSTAKVKLACSSALWCPERTRPRTSRRTSSSAMSALSSAALTGA